MLGFFRSFINSRLGVVITLGFLGLIALAFASADVTGSGFGGVAGGDRIAIVGKSRIATSDLSKAVTSSFENERQQNPTLTMKQFLAQGALDDVLNGMVDRTAMLEWGKKNGILISDRLIDSEIVKIPAFQGPDGKFSQDAYKQLLNARGLSDALVRDDIAKGLMARQLLVPASFGAVMPLDAATRYAALLKEQRTGAIAVIPSLAFAPKTPPSDADLAAFWKGNTGRYMRPEHRVVRFALLDEASLKNIPAPSDAEVAQRYKLNAAVYAPSETRNLTQVIVPTEAAAKALAAEIAGGKAIDAAAAAKGLSASKLPDMGRDALVNQTSRTVSDAVYAAAQGTIPTPQKSGLGWHVIRVDAINRKPGKTLDQAKPEILAALTTEKRHAALTDVSAKIEQQFESGTGLADVARSLGLTVVTTAPLQADGTVFGKPDEKAPADIAPALAAAFGMEREGAPQLAEVQAGSKFAIFDVSAITAAAPAPLAEIKDVVTRDFAMNSGFAQAKAAADKVLAAIAKGTPLADAIKALGITAPPVQPIDMNRQQVSAMQQQQQRVPPPLALMFSMARNTSKKLEAPNKAGWFVVTLKDVVPGTIAANDPMLPGAQRELGTVVGREYAEQLRNAIRTEVTVKRNDTAIKSVQSQLTGGQ